MLGDKRLFDDMARVASGAAGALGGIKSRMEGELRDQVERLLARMNLVTREEFDVMAEVARNARAAQEVLTERVAALEAKLAATAAPAPASPAGARAKRAPVAKKGGAKDDNGGGSKTTPDRRRRARS